MKKYTRVAMFLTVVAVSFFGLVAMLPFVVQRAHGLEKIQAATATHEARRQMVDDHISTEIAKINPEASEEETSLDGILPFLSNIPTIVYALVIAAIIGLVVRTGGTIER